MMTPKPSYALTEGQATASADSPEGTPARRMPIIGVGASAGGLHALELFFGQVPAQSGAVYVVVQHLDPDKSSLLAELLQRVCALPVRQAEDQTRVQPDHVYVAPPGQELTLLHGTLHLLKPAAARGQNLPIDFFLRALALDQGPLAAGVILSGMGSDGTLGLRALKEKGGAVFVQTPETAHFPAMPRNAVDAELADVVAPPEELPARILAYFAHPLLNQSLGTVGPGAQQVRGALEKILILVRAQTGHDFSAYKKSTVYRRIQRRMAIHQLREVEEYVHFVRANPVEAELLFKELLIGVTSFFRDGPVWQHIKDEVIPKLLAQYPDGAGLRAWVPACSTGEEAYTLAMVFSEALQALQPSARYTLQIFATDLDKEAIEKARQGRYADNITADVSPERLERFFSKVPEGYCISKDIRGMVIFAQQSIGVDPPFAKLHLLSCRNLLIYLESDLQQQLMHLFHSSLLPGGYLVLGSAETVGQASKLFATAGAKTRIYRRVGGVSRPGAVGLPMQGHGSGGGAGHMPAATRLHEEALGSTAGVVPSLQSLADQVLLRKFAPSAVLANAEGDIVYFSGKTGKFLEPPAGKANLNLFAMARPSLRQPLFEAFTRANRQKETITLDDALLGAPGSPGQAVRITVEPLAEPRSLDGMLMVVFAEMQRALDALPPGPPSDRAHDAQVAELMRELARAREEHQATREEMQTSQEELKSANEELQSANEELTTSREEMQSMNEELQTVNAELQTRVDALARASDDMENLLNSTDIATLFLDSHLNVRRYTTRATGLIKLIPTDVGRPISDLSTDLQMDLAGDAAEVLRTLMFREAEVQASGPRWFRVRTMPYRTQDNRIDGVVITFVDITASKATEAALRKVNEKS